MTDQPAADDCCAPDDRPRPAGATERRRACRIFRALADPTRIEVFALIAARPEPLCVCDIVARFDVSQPTISHHLKILREAGLVRATRRGTWAYYDVCPSGAAAARAALSSLLPEPTVSTEPAVSTEPTVPTG